MSWISLDEAKAMLYGWLEAERLVMSGKSYRIGNRQLTRANLDEIREGITYWRKEVAKLESGRSGKGMKVWRAVPRDW